MEINYLPSLFLKNVSLKTHDDQLRNNYKKNS